MCLSKGPVKGLIQNWVSKGGLGRACVNPKVPFLEILVTYMSYCLCKIEYIVNGQNMPRINLLSTKLKVSGGNCCLKLDTHLPNKFLLFASLKALKSYEKCVLFHFKSSFRSQNI